jgi:hypothetical protein
MLMNDDATEPTSAAMPSSRGASFSGAAVGRRVAWLSERLRAMAAAEWAPWVALLAALLLASCAEVRRKD